MSDDAANTGFREDGLPAARRVGEALAAVGGGAIGVGEMEGIAATVGPWLKVWLAAVVLNAVPAFMPPTWSLLAYFHLAQGLPILPLAAVGALGAATGRAVLAHASRAVGDRFVPARRRSNIEALARALRGRPSLALPTLGLFALGPVPSSHLFVAAGLARAPLPPLLAVFAAARFVSYLLWVEAAEVADRSLRDALGPRIDGWLVAALQIAGFGLIYLATRVEWERVLGRWLGPSKEG